MNIGESIREKRMKKGWSQGKLAEMVYVSQQTVGLWENERVFPQLDSLILLADVFECSLDDLAGRKWKEKNI